MTQAPPTADRTDGALPRPRVSLTIGKLDGVHAGHRHLAAHAQAVADEIGARSAAVVLHPDPATVLAGRAVPRLTTIDDRCLRLRSFGLEIVEPWRFTGEVAGLSPRAFVDQLVDRFEIAAMVVGPDFAFGRGRSGNLNALTKLGEDVGFGVHVVPPLAVAGEWVSSRRIRGVIAEGDIDLARTLLRAPPRVVGTVVHGSARGRTLGFPTANLDPTAEFAVPANGIYTVVAQWRDPSSSRAIFVRGVASVGVRPTFDHGARLLEVHLLDFDGDLYGREITVDFLDRQRPEVRFDDVGALVEQMGRDVALAVARHELEAAAPWIVDPDGVALRVVGRDLADLCERTVVACRAPDRAGAETGDQPRRALSLSAGDRDALYARWLSAIGEGLRWASVYEAGPGSLHALTRWTERVDSDRGGPAARGPIRVRPDGWLEADIAAEDR